MENYLQTNHGRGSLWESAKDEPCQASKETTAVSAEGRLSVVKEVQHERLPRRPRQGANPELCAPQLIKGQPARKWGERQCFCQQPCFTAALNNALVKGDQRLQSRKDNTKWERNLHSHLCSFLCSLVSHQPTCLHQKEPGVFPPWRNKSTAQNFPKR